MKARDIMTTDVVTVGPDASVHEIARSLVDKHLTALPVINADGAPIGMVSEGDLLGPEDTTREARREAWLTLLAEGEPLSPTFLEWLYSQRRSASYLMSKPVISIDEGTDVNEIARVLAAHHVKRVPVVRDGRFVGIVSRGDLLRALYQNSVS